MKYNFDREDGVIIFPVDFNGEETLRMLLDTGASVSSFDRNVLEMADYDLNNPVSKEMVETANGIIEVDLFEMKSLSAFGITRRNVAVQVYDYLRVQAHLYGQGADDGFSDRHRRRANQRYCAHQPRNSGRRARGAQGRV